MKKNLYLLLLITGLLFIAGCSSGSEARTSGGLSMDAFEGGDEALSMEFAEGSPPQRVMDGGIQPFNVRVSLENLGEQDIQADSGYVVLGGFSSRDLDLEDSSRAIPEMRGVRKQGSNTIPGGRGQVTFSNLKYLPNLSSGTNVQSLYANVCYPYKTTSVISLCIAGDTLVVQDSDSAICDLESEREIANSGSPLKIENVQQYPAGRNSLEFQFDIVHIPTQNRGRVYESGSINSQCRINDVSSSSVDSIVSQNVVDFKIDSDPLVVSCNGEGPQGKIQLTNNKATVFCNVDTQGEEEYVKPISVELNFDYMERIQAELEIQHNSR